jgi:secondary thiamine-phosphate synthase enzyme
MARFISEVSPEALDYRHNDFLVRVVNMEEDECPNGHAHCQHLLLNTSESIPLMAGRLQLGRWQRIFLVELDHARPRDVVVQTMGC